MFFPLRSPEQILELNRWIKDYAAQNGCIYLDYFSAMVDDKGLLKADLAEDGLHPNDKGFAIMAPLAQKAIDQALRALLQLPVNLRGQTRYAALLLTACSTHPAPRP